MIDIDNFRTINESLGLEAGNKIIMELAGLIGAVVADHGIIARYGGDEFSALLPEANLARAREIAEQVRAGVAAYDFSGHTAGEHIAVTASIGISSFPETADELSAFKEKADASLYRAKESGRNRVEHIE
jgi:diguanylate cyclase (GGDEF)-like protein